MTISERIGTRRGENIDDFQAARFGYRQAV
jgi:hypothetical protein